MNSNQSRKVPEKSSNRFKRKVAKLNANTFYQLEPRHSTTPASRLNVLSIFLASFTTSVIVTLFDAVTIITRCYFTCWRFVRCFANDVSLIKSTCPYNVTLCTLWWLKMWELEINGKALCLLLKLLIFLLSFVESEYIFPKWKHDTEARDCIVYR